MHSKTVAVVREHIDDEYEVVVHFHCLRIFDDSPSYYVEIQHGGDMTLITVRERKDGYDGTDPLIGMPYRCGPENAEIRDRLDRALDTLAYHTEQ
jgi:hypothetical protein